MGETIRDVMTANPVTVPTSASLTEAAQLMDERDIGDVVVVKDGQQVCGIVTDRDIVVRGVAKGRDPTSTTVDEVCSHDLVTVGPDEQPETVVRLMREKAVRRVVVTEGDRAVGVVSIGDLALERDPRSALADISAAPPNE